MSRRKEVAKTAAEALKTDAVRSRIMAAVRQRGTAAELTVRRCLRRLGYRFQCNRRELPGSPDLLLPKLSVAIFVHGCFWHRHRCRYATTPKTNREFWLNKFSANRKRDRRVRKELRNAGWRTFVVWECWTRDKEPELRLMRLLAGVRQGPNDETRCRSLPPVRR
jgi:DNA mismatch endonuclease (patch repair protein)